ncbi:MAG: TolC family outer membrane protein [Zoogloeaceae bacterium]|jgi:outer membrane protein|nr:TolC family outer membrane protein [Zoogloeaceae bacterium]
MRDNRLSTIALLGAILCGTANGETLTLAGLLARAQGSEPTFLAAQTDVAAAQARENQAFGMMLPQLSFTGSAHANDRSYRTRSPNVPTEEASYRSHSLQLSLTQPIWRYGNWVGWKQAQKGVAQFHFQLEGAGQDLFARVVSAWFDLLAARDTLAFTERQEAAWHFYWKTTARGETLGENSLLEATEARAKLDQAIADRVVAQTDVEIKRALLEQIVGTLGEFDLPEMRAEAELADPSREKLEAWLLDVERRNPRLLAASSAYETASDEVRKERANHYPTLDLVASYGKNTQDEVGTQAYQPGYDIKQGSVGLQLTIPIFAGGTVSAKVREAIARQDKARLEVEASRRAAVMTTKEAWFSWVGARARAQAGKQMVQAAHLSLKQARLGEETGESGTYEILQAEEQLRKGERDFRKARYDQVVSYVRLKSLAGLLMTEDIVALDALLLPTAHEKTPAGEK